MIKKKTMKLKVSQKKLGKEKNYMLSCLSFLYVWSKMSSFTNLIWDWSPCHLDASIITSPKPSTVQASKLAIWAPCCSRRNCLLSMKVEVMNVTICAEEQVAFIITDNSIMLGNPAGALWHSARLLLGTFSWCCGCTGYCLMIINFALLERSSKLTFMGRSEIEKSLPKDEACWVRMDSNNVKIRI